jgi:hypothetical protein
MSLCAFSNPWTLASMVPVVTKRKATRSHGHSLPSRGCSFSVCEDGLDATIPSCQTTITESDAGCPWGFSSRSRLARGFPAQVRLNSLPMSHRISPLIEATTIAPKSRKSLSKPTFPRRSLGYSERDMSDVHESNMSWRICGLGAGKWGSAMHSKSPRLLGCKGKSPTLRIHS